MNDKCNQYRKLKLLALLVICFVGCSAVNMVAQNTDKKAKAIHIALNVVDEGGNPLPNTQITVGEGLVHAVTNEQGIFEFEARPSERITINKEGYEKLSGLASYFAKENMVVLKQSALLATTEDIVRLPYLNSHRRYSVDQRTTLTGKDLERYPSTDIRNAFVGLVPGLEVTESDGQPGVSTQESVSGRGEFSGWMKGFGNKVNMWTRGKAPIVVVDDVEIELAEMNLDPDEIESVSVIKDVVGKAMYGSTGSSGIIFVKTKRGIRNDRELNVNVESGVSIADRFPTRHYVGGADYARLNNLARENSGRDPLYQQTDIDEYAKNDPYSLRYPSNNYSDMMFKDARHYLRANVSSRGGSDVMKYYAYIGYAGEGDNMKLGNTADYNRLNVRTNIDVKVNNFINLNFDFVGNTALRSSPNYGYSASAGAGSTSDGEFDIFEMFSMMSDARTISPIAFPVYAVNSKGERIGYGITQNYSRNPIGSMVDNGYYTEQNRMGSAAVGLDIDLNHLVKGLKSRTYLGFNVYNFRRIGKSVQYDSWIYNPNFTSDADMWSRKTTATKESNEKNLNEYYAQRFSFYETVSYDRTWGKHALNTALTFQMYRLIRRLVEEPLRTVNTNLAIQYVYNDRYILNGALNWAANQFLAKNERFRIFPTVGAGWILSEENFMKGTRWIDFLKLRAEFGMIGNTDYESGYNYDTKWSYGDINGFGKVSSGYGGNWFGSTSYIPKQGSYNRLQNDYLGFCTQKEFSVGFEAMLLNKRLSLDFVYYNNLQQGQIQRPANLYPLYSGMQVDGPYINYGSTRYWGGEGSVKWSDKIGKVKYTVIGNANLQRSRYLIVDEPFYPENEQYRKTAGQLGGTIFGQTYQGKYLSDDEAQKTNSTFDAASRFRAGDLIYKDMNGDGVINGNDASPIGNSTPLLLFSTNIALEWNRFEFFLVGSGAACFDRNLRSFDYFTNGSGDNNYSEWVRDNIGEAYPRLSYDAMNNNNQTSSFWLRDGSFFKIKNVEVAYNLPIPTQRSMGLRGIRFFVRASNLLTISGISDIDPEAPQSGLSRYPLNRTIIGGAKLTF